MTRASNKKIITRWLAKKCGFLKTHHWNPTNLHVKSHNLLRQYFSLDRLDNAFQMMVVRPEGFIKGWIKL